MTDKNSSDEDETEGPTLDEAPEHWERITQEDLRDIIEDEQDRFNQHLDVTEEQIRAQSRAKSKVFLTWLLFFILLWQYYNLISDRGIECLLNFIKTLLLTLGKSLPAVSSELLISLSGLVPITVFSLRKYLGVDRDNFEKFVVCGKCSKLFKEQECVKIVNGKSQGKTCDNVLFPRANRRKECGGQLVKRIVLSNGQVKFYPLHTYCYKSVISSLETLLKRPGFKEKCEEWRERTVGRSTFADVFDGQVWKDFLNYKGQDFLNIENSYGLMLNCHWFQPFKRRTDISIGVLYLAIMNLPRSDRFKKENIILVGIIPSMCKEPPTLTHFLSPLVDELLALWKGVNVNALNSTIVKVRAALLCCASDIPAARKLCGFLGHSAHKGCSHCYKTFPGGFGEKKDYSGFEDRDSWPKRTDEQHRRDAFKTLRCKCKTARKKLEKNLGTRYTELLRLPYYGSITMCIIDPMHNLFLGTAKTLFKIWTKNEIFSKENIAEIERRIENMNSTSDIGRLPGNITTNYGGFTASQWQNWILYYSLYCLEEILPEEDMNCLQSFVIACRLLCKTSITRTDLFLADRKLLDFALKFENVYGKEAVTPNIHLHMHLKQCVENYGSVYGFWCFSFERYNGLLGNFHTNHRFIEAQLMRKFICMTSVADLQYTLPMEYRNVFFPLCKKLLRDSIVEKSNGEISYDKISQFQSIIRGPIQILSREWTDLTNIDLPNKFIISSFDNDDLLQLKELYSLLYPTLQFNVQRMNRTFRKYNSVTVMDERFGSTLNTRLASSGKIMASWAGDDGKIEPTPKERPGLVMFYLRHTIIVNSKDTHHVFAAVQWYKRIDDAVSYRNPLTVWKANDFEEAGPATFIPVQRIACRFVNGQHKIGNTKAIVVSPLIRHIFQ